MRRTDLGAHLESPLARIEHRLRARLADEIEPSPLFVIGLPRAGTTLAYQAIFARYDVAALTNLRAALYAAPAVAALAARFVPTRRRDFTSEQGRTSGLTGLHEGSRFFGRWFDRPDRPARLDAEHTAEDLRQTFAAMQAIDRRPIVAKNVFNLRAIDSLANWLPQSLFVVVERSPDTHIASLVEATARTGVTWFSIPPLDERMAGADLVERCTDQVRQLDEELAWRLRSVDSRRWTPIAYEDLCDDPEHALGRVRELFVRNGLELRPRGQPLKPFKPPRLAVSEQVRAAVRTLTPSPIERQAPVSATVRPVQHVALELVGELSPADLARRGHAFSLVCAAHGLTRVRQEPGVATVRLEVRPSAARSHRVQWMSTPTARLPVLHATGEPPDLLAELSFWASGAGEADRPTDRYGRHLRADSVQVEVGLDPCVAWASRIVDAVHAEMSRQIPGLSRRTAPEPNFATHDLDYLSAGRSSDIRRLAKSLLQAMGRHRSLSETRAVAGALLAALGGRPVLNNIETVLRREATLGVRSSWNVIIEGRHPRDANYSLDSVEFAAFVASVRRWNGEIGAHGSYGSLDRPTGLKSEYASARSHGLDPVGGRQHWLRGTVSDLPDALDEAGAAYDATFGWPDGPGFRHGFAGPYTLFDPVHSAARGVLEFPLVLMDSALAAQDFAGTDWRSEADKVAAEIRSPAACGAMTVLWHDTTFAGGHHPPEVTDYFWSVLEDLGPWDTPGGRVQDLRDRFVRAGALGGS